MAATRKKREADESTRNKRWFNNSPMIFKRRWNWDMRMNPWWNSWNGNVERFYRQADENDKDENSNREKREAGDVGREKRWNFNSPMMYSRRWNNWMNPSWNSWFGNFKRFYRKADIQSNDKLSEREKREEDGSNRDKRWNGNSLMMYNSKSGWNNWMNSWWNFWPGNFGRFYREAEENTDAQSDSKLKRETEETGREKRWGFDSPMTSNGRQIWNSWMNPWWNSWYGNFGRSYREAEGDSNDESSVREKRETKDLSREKRWHFGSPMMYNRGWGWNNWMNPWWDSWYGNTGRSYREAERNIKDKSSSREKREAEGLERDKRWNLNHPMMHSRMWQWDDWMDSLWNSWPGYAGRSYREAEENSHDESFSRQKRDVTESERKKRWYFDSPMMGNRGWRWGNNWMNPWWNSWYGNYGRSYREAEGDSNVGSPIREKRETKDSSREKRWGFGSPMMYYRDWRWNNWMNSWWNSWSGNYGRSYREAEGNSNDESFVREKREAKDSSREKRWGFGSPMMYNRGWRWGNNWMNPWWNSWHGNYGRSYREAEADSNDESLVREKRETKDSSREKRWHFGSPMMYNRDWRWNNWMNPWWNSWSRNFGRSYREAEADSNDGSSLREKRETKDSSREKRWHFGSPMMYNRGWGWNNWMNPWWNSWYGNNYGRHYREAEGKSHEESSSRQKREVAESERTKRWHFDQPMMGSRGWGWNNWMNQWWNSWPENFGRFYREAEVNSNEKSSFREKHETEESGREKRWGSESPMMYNKGWGWYNWMNPWWSSWYGNGRFYREAERPLGGQSNMMKKRETEERAKEKDGI